MTNAEKYLKDGVDIEEFIKELHLFWWFNEYDICEGIRKFLSTEAKKKKPQLTEDERVILRNIEFKDYNIIGRKESGDLYVNYRENDSFNGVLLIMLKKHLFQFIKERRRIRNKRINKGGIKIMNKEYIKEIIKAFLQREEEEYKAISEMNVTEVIKEESFKRINVIKTLINHAETDYEVFFEIISENINKEIKKSSKSSK